MAPRRRKYLSPWLAEPLLIPSVCTTSSNVTGAVVEKMKPKISPTDRGIPSTCVTRTESSINSHWALGRVIARGRWRLATSPFEPSSTSVSPFPVLRGTLLLLFIRRIQKYLNIPNNARHLPRSDGTFLFLGKLPHVLAVINCNQIRGFCCFIACVFTPARELAETKPQFKTHARTEAERIRLRSMRLVAVV